MQFWDNGLVVGDGPNKIFIAHESQNHSAPLHAIASVVNESGKGNSSHFMGEQYELQTGEGTSIQTLV
eukprot:8199154-Karenia_brevis.AAC.1